MEDKYIDGKEYQDEYETPVFEKEEIPAFPEEIIEEFNGDRLCLQCSSCHGCK